MMMRPYISLVVLLSVLTACSWFEKKANPPLEGERTAVLQRDDQTKPSDSGTPSLDAAQEVNAWTAMNFNAAQGGVNANVTPRFEKMWDISIGEALEGRKKITARPIGAEGKIFAMDNRGYVTAINAQTGKEIWRVRTRAETGTALAGGFAYDNGVLFVTNGFSELLAISAANGGKIWNVKLDAPVRSAPTVFEGKLYVVSRNNQSFAIEATSGRILWQHRGLLELSGVLSGGGPAADSDMVLMPYSSGELAALSSGNGSVLWGESLASGRPENNLATLHDFRAPPVMLKDMVITANYAANITASDRRLGERVWSHDFGALQPMTVSGDTVFLISTNAQLMAINRRNGEIFWSKSLQSREHEVDEAQEYWYGPLLLNGELFIISADGRGELRDVATGEIKSVFEDLEAPAENPIVMHKMIYWVTASGEVVAYQ